MSANWCLLRLCRRHLRGNALRRLSDDGNVRPKMGAYRHDVFAGLPPAYTGGEPTTSDMMFIKPPISGANDNELLAPPAGSKETPQLWDDPFRFAIEGDFEEKRFTEVTASRAEWKWVQRILPKQLIPEVPAHESYPTPSGWIPPKSPPPALPYHIARNRYHLFPLFLECRRDQLDMETLEYDYVELVVMMQITGDIFKVSQFNFIKLVTEFFGTVPANSACETDLRQYLESKLDRKIGTHVNEMQGKIRVKGADRSDVEKFLIEKGF